MGVPALCPFISALLRTWKLQLLTCDSEILKNPKHKTGPTQSPSESKVRLHRQCQHATTRIIASNMWVSWVVNGTANKMGRCMDNAPEICPLTHPLGSWLIGWRSSQTVYQFHCIKEDHYLPKGPMVLQDSKLHGGFPGSPVLLRLSRALYTLWSSWDFP